MNIKKKYLIGEKFKNNKGLEFEIIGYGETNYRKIKFLETGFVNEVQITHIRTGKVQDYLDKTYYGVGYLGGSEKCNKILLSRWVNMISRCYNPNDSKHKTYGGNGVYVCDRWHNFKNYESDISSKDNFDLMIKDSKIWSVDKDILIKGNKCYSNETTLIVSKSDNSKELIKRSGSPSKYNKLKVDKLDMNGNYICTYNYIKEAGELNNVAYQSICSVCKGKRNSAGGFKWRYSEVEGGNKC